MTTTKKEVLFEGKIEAIDYFDDNGDFVVRAVWDDRDEHTPKNIVAFHEWADTMAKRLTSKK